MRIPIAHALGHPKRLAVNTQRLDLLSQPTLSFALLDPKRYPLLNLTPHLLGQTPSAAIIFNAANERAVADFLSGKIGFLDIPDQIARALDRDPSITPPSLDDIFELDRVFRA